MSMTKWMMLKESLGRHGTNKKTYESGGHVMVGDGMMLAKDIGKLNFYDADAVTERKYFEVAAWRVQVPSMGLSFIGVLE